MPSLPPRSPSPMLRGTILVVVVLALLGAGCRVDSGDMVSEQVDPSRSAMTRSGDEVDSGDGQSGGEPAGAAAVGDVSVADVDCELPGDGSPTGLTTEGDALFARYTSSGADVATYRLAVEIDPDSGAVAGAMRATVVEGDTDTLNFRVFAGLDAFDADLAITKVAVDGEAVEVTVQDALLSVPVSPSSDGAHDLELEFRYTVSQMAADEDIFGALSGSTLEPDQIGLLGRTASGMQLGHWFPVWLPAGSRADPDPAGFGDIGAFPAASVCATIAVPAGFEVVTSGVRTDTSQSSIVEVGLGLRDFSMVVSNDIEMTVGRADGVEIRVWGAKADPAASAAVLDYAITAQTALADAFGPYPWTEVDLVSTPLGGGVGGMEWPGMIWLERSIFAGGLPGMAGFGDLLGDADLESLLGAIGGEALTTTLEWTIAHELGHEWWHATVGNDSIESPAVDEPLAQFAACVAMQRIHPDRWRAICEAQTIEQYAQARAFGIADAAADQASDRFDSSLQYGAVIYGKAPGFYLATADLIGWDALIGALADFIAGNSFALVSTEALRTHLIASAGADGDAVGELWDRWFRQTHGDEDIAPADLFGGLALDGLGEGSPELDELLEGLATGELDFEALFRDLEGLEGLEGIDPSDLQALLDALLNGG